TDRFGFGPACSERDIDINQMPNPAVPIEFSYVIVVISNFCTSDACRLGNIHVSCGGFNFDKGPTIHPTMLRRISDDDCLVNNGDPLGQSEVLIFEYYKMKLSSKAAVAGEMNHIRATINGKVLSHDMNNNFNGSGNHSADQNNNECTVREQDRFMPIANVIRIMRKILPPHAKISDDAKETIQECVSEYISFITGEANERCQREQRKTITAEDVLWAMSKLGFDDYVEPLTLYLHRYRELEGEHGSIRTCEPLLKLSRAAMDHFEPYGRHK
uniref:Transcription factor CBF/NF-Y/archaeal histone domain-containing protein n=1 Tax=Chenopodium quinoa TaxID=63459 RepID=A0A803M1J3_CHEQI